MVTASDDRRTLFVLAGGNFAQLGSRFLLGALVPLILLEFAVTKSDVGLALTGMWAVYALLQFPSGILADQYGEKPIVLLGLGGASIGAVLVAVAPSFRLFAVSVLVLGAATGLFYPPASTLITRLYEAHGKAISTMTALGTISGIVYPALGGVIAVRYGWRSAVALSVAIAVPALLLAIRLVPRLPTTNPAGGLRTSIDVARYRRLLIRPTFAYTLVLATVLFFVFQGFASFYPTFVVEYHGLDSDVAGVLFGAVFGLSALAQPVIGRLSDRLSRDLAIGTAVALAMAGFVVLLAVPARVGLLGGSALLGLGISWSGAMQARVFDTLTEDARGFGFGLARTAYSLLGATGSFVVGTLAETGGWLVGYGVLVGLLAGILVLLGVNRVARLGL